MSKFIYIKKPNESTVTRVDRVYRDGNIISKIYKDGEEIYCVYKDGEIVFSTGTNGTYTFAPTVKGIYRVTVVGGGGSGACTIDWGGKTGARQNAKSGGTGGGGGYTCVADFFCQKGETFNITVGAGGKVGPNKDLQEHTSGAQTGVAGCIYNTTNNGEDGKETSVVFSASKYIRAGGGQRGMAVHEEPVNRHGGAGATSGSISGQKQTIGTFNGNDGGFRRGWTPGSTYDFVAGGTSYYGQYGSGGGWGDFSYTAHAYAGSDGGVIIQYVGHATS